MTAARTVEDVTDHLPGLTARETNGRRSNRRRSPSPLERFLLVVGINHQGVRLYRFLRLAGHQKFVMRAGPPHVTRRAYTTDPSVWTVKDSAGPEHVAITFDRKVG